MKAVIYDKYGPPEVLRIADVSKPIPCEDEILVHIHASAVNSADVRTRALNAPGLMKYIMRFIIGWNGPKQPILGTVFSGTVVEKGKSSDTFNVGDEIFGTSPGVSYGCHAEYIAIKEGSAMSLKPPHASHEEAVSLIFGGTTAQYFLNKAKPVKDQTILIYGASGAVGSSATQIAKILGLYVVGVASSKNEALLRELGADDFIDYTKKSLSEINEKFDIVFDAVGKASKKDCKRLLKPDGHFITVAGLDIAKENKEQMNNLNIWYEDGRMKPVIDRIYTMDEIQEAHSYVDKGHKRGSVVITI